MKLLHVLIVCSLILNIFFVALTFKNISDQQKDTLSIVRTEAIDRLNFDNQLLALLTDGNTDDIAKAKEQLQTSHRVSSRLIYWIDTGEIDKVIARIQNAN